MSLGRVAITGGRGFLGWHLACRLKAVHGVDPVLLGRPELADPTTLAEHLRDVDTVFHIAGVNRGTDEEVEHGNIVLAKRLGDALNTEGRPVTVVYANTVHVDRDDSYGRGKRAAADILLEAAQGERGTFVDVRLPNLFGEHGRPRYNSFVATFADAVARGETPTVTQDREIPLLHAQRAAAALVAGAIEHPVDAFTPGAPAVSVSGVLDRFRHFDALYRTRGEIPDLTSPLEVDLFNTYRSYLFPTQFPLLLNQHEDARGRLFEAVRSHGGTGQSFVSTTVPGATRGDHYHLRKVERFLVVRGEGEIALRRLYHDVVVRFRVSGDRPAFVDMPTMWVHNIKNVGQEELVTVFWADQLLDPAAPDQYPELVEAGSV